MCEEPFPLLLGAKREGGRDGGGSDDAGRDEG
jgi:hypothetical protein